MIGKIPPEVMARLVYTRLGFADSDVLVGPATGEDAAIIDIGDGKALVVHSDAITGASESLGWLAVNIVANDIAVRGVKPRWFLMSLFLPENSSENLLSTIMRQVDEAARDLKIMVVGGHTEVTSGLDRPIAGTTAIGIADKEKIVTTSGAKTGDYVIMTKTTAIEGTAILCTDFASLLKDRGVDRYTIEKGSKFLAKISVVKEALALAENRIATAMHDPTEGGILGGVAELAYASRRTIELWVDKVPIARETEIATEALKINALKLISSGALIATVPLDKLNESFEVLQKIGVEASVIGRVKDYAGHLVEIVRGSLIEYVDDVYVADELFRLWRGKQKSRLIDYYG
ncbi:AIR synthase family protein [Candidatus Bathyarchaeota archaeon]|nr:AIR synthase family protein [Candidatus Bathyarchaeota archaeon]MBS7613311.1 AIR synthase family protein [Candidatus Bathyarchaeota archaeon]